MATTFGFLLTTVLTGTANAATAGMVDGTCTSRDGDFWIQWSFTEDRAGLWSILATGELFIIVCDSERDDGLREPRNWIELLERSRLILRDVR